MEIRLKSALKIAIKELGIAAVLGMVSWLFLAGNFGTVFVLTLLIRYSMRRIVKSDSVIVEESTSEKED